jgi:hypothetical protein
MQRRGLWGACALVAMTVGLPLGPALADICEVYPGSGAKGLWTDQNCDKPYQDKGGGAARSPSVQPPSSGNNLRERLRQSLGAAGTPQSATARDKWVDAHARAEQATTSASLTNDPQEKAQFRRAYEAAMRDLRQAGNEMVASTSDPAEKARLRALMQENETAGARAAAEAGIGGQPAPPQQAAPPPPAPPSQADQRSGFMASLSPMCQQAFQAYTYGARDSAGSRTATDKAITGFRNINHSYEGVGGCRDQVQRLANILGVDLPPVDSENANPAAVLSAGVQLLAGLTGMGVGAAPPQPALAPPQNNDPNATRKQQEFAQLSPQCRDQLNSFLQGADSGDRDKAATTYASLRAQCDGPVRALAGAEGLALPERIMTSRSQRLMDRARSGDVGALPGTAGAVAQGGGGSFDAGEALEFGFALLQIFSGVAGAYVATPGGAAARMGSIGNRSVRGTIGQGAPTYRPSPSPSQSTITGTIGK